MSKNIEIEAKAMIDESSYDSLISLYQSDTNRVYRQDNYYIDTKDFNLSDNKLGVRIRKKDDFIEFTVKDKLKEGKLEINQTISKEDFDNFINNKILPDGEVYQYIYKKTKTPKESLLFYALLITYRLDVNYKNCLISIDKSIYNDITDYEVECESNSMNNTKDVLKEFLDNKKIPYNENHISKLKRARETLKRLH